MSAALWLLPAALTAALYVLVFFIVPALRGTPNPFTYNEESGSPLAWLAIKLGYLVWRFLGLGDHYTGDRLHIVLTLTGLALLTAWLVRRHNWLGLFGLGWMLTRIGSVWLRSKILAYVCIAGFYYLLLVAGHLLGRFYFRYQEKLNWDV